MKKVITVGGWSWYCDQVRAKVNKELTQDQYSDIMRNFYIKGKSWEDAAASVS